MLVTAAARSGAWVRIPLKSWMFFFRPCSVALQGHMKEKNVEPHKKKRKVVNTPASYSGSPEFKS
jgi:hypothetical protein